MISKQMTENIPSNVYCMGHDERSAQFHADKTDPLTASDFKQPPVVAYGIDQQGGKGGANYTVDVAPTLCADSHGTPHAVAQEVCYTIPHDERSMCCKPNVADTMSHYVNYVAVCKDEPTSAGFARGQSCNTRGIGYKEEQSPTIIAGDVPLVMSTTGGQNAYCIGDGQMNQPMMTDKVGALNCMHNGGQKVMQKLVTENKQLEACAPTMDEDSTDKT